MIAPEKNNGDYFYTLFLELDDMKGNNILLEILRRLANDIEIKLQENYHYKYCRELNQLSKLQLFIIKPKHKDIRSRCKRSILDAYIYICQSRGQKVSTIKPVVLHSKINWSRDFEGFFIKDTGINDR